MWVKIWKATLPILKPGVFLGEAGAAPLSAKLAGEKHKMFLSADSVKIAKHLLPFKNSASLKIIQNSAQPR